MGNKIVKNTILEIVENQIEGNNPYYVREAYEELLDLDYSKEDAQNHNAVETMLEEVYDEEAFWNNEEEPWIGMEILLEQGMELYEHPESEEALTYWEEAWTLLKKNVKNAYKKPEIFEVDEATEFRYGYESCLQDMASIYRERNEYEKCISFCREVMEVFAWEQEESNVYRSIIGHVLRESDHEEEADQWFDEWIKNEPENFEAASNAVYHWLKRNKQEKGEELLEKLINEKMECDDNNCMLFSRASFFYRELGEDQKAELYGRKLDEYMEKAQDEPLLFGEEENFRLYGDWDDSFYDMPSSQPIVKDKKIYPNEPCPCGSGKKYKKCCGKNR